MINDLKERVLEQAIVEKDKMKLEKRHHRNMIFEAALIAVFARHPSNHGLLSESPDNFRGHYAQHYDFSKASDLEFKMFFRYYWTMRVAAPLFFISKNQGHSLRLLPRLVEAKNVDYQYGGKSSKAVKFRIKIFTVELDRWRYYTHGFAVSSWSSAPTRQDVPLGAGMPTPMPAATPISVPTTTTSSTKRLAGEKRLRMSDGSSAILTQGTDVPHMHLQELSFTNNTPTSLGINLTSESISTPFAYSTQSASVEEVDMASFMSPYRNQPYYQSLTSSSFASGNAPTRPLYDIIRDPLIREVDSFIAEVAYLLAQCYRGVDAEDRLSDMQIGITIPFYMKLCIEYLDNFQRINDRNVS
jgi:hypothetical protein